MTNYRTALVDVLTTTLEPVLLSLGFVKVKATRWRWRDLEIRAVIDSKASDPYRGGAFTLEVERSDNGKFEVKLAGRVRVDQLLDVPQRQEALELRNAVAARLPRPDEQHLALIPDSVRPEYLKAFEPAHDLEPRMWMRYHDENDLREWATLLASMMPDFVRRAQTLDPHALVLGKAMKW